MSNEKRDFSDFSLDEITSIVAEAGKKAAKESLDMGLEVLSKDLETGKLYAVKKNDNGELVKRFLMDEEVKSKGTK